MIHQCNDASDGRPGCLIEADDRYTMDFGDVEPDAKIYWCAACGPEAHAMNEAMKKMGIRDPNFARDLEEAIKAAEKQRN